MASLPLCFLFYLLTLPLAVDFIALPIEITKKVLFVHVKVNQVICTNIKIGSISMQYDANTFNLVFEEDVTLTCYAYISAGIFGSGNLSIGLKVPAGQDVLISSESDTNCIVSNAKVERQGLKPEITDLNVISGSIGGVVEAGVKVAFPDAVVDQITTKLQIIVQAMTNYTAVAMDPVPSYNPKYVDINTLSIAKFKELVQELPSIFGTKLVATIPTPNSFQVNGSFVNNIDLLSQYGQFKASSDVSIVATTSFKDVSCDADLNECVLEDGLQLYNVRFKFKQVSIPLFDQFIAPTALEFLNKMVAANTTGLTIKNAYMSTAMSYVGEIFTRM